MNGFLQISLAIDHLKFFILEISNANKNSRTRYITTDVEPKHQ